MTVFACLDGRWAPQVGMDLVTKITLTQGVAQLPYWLAHELGILARITCAHRLVGFVESDASDCPILDHLADGIRDDVT